MEWVGGEPGVVGVKGGGGLGVVRSRGGDQGVGGSRMVESRGWVDGGLRKGSKAGEGHEVRGPGVVGVMLSGPGVVESSGGRVGVKGKISGVVGSRGPGIVRVKWIGVQHWWGEGIRDQR